MQKRQGTVQDSFLVVVAFCAALGAAPRLSAREQVFVEFYDPTGSLLLGPVTLLGLKGLVPGHEFVHTWTRELAGRVPEAVSQGVTVCFNLDRPSVSLIDALVEGAPLQKVVFHFVRDVNTAPAEFFRITLEHVEVVLSRVQLPATFEEANRARDLEHIVGLRFDSETLESLATDPPIEQIHFIRGDINGDVALDLSDAIALFSYLFLGGRLLCPRAGDTNVDAALDISDGVYLLNYLFIGGRPPAGPFPRCGPGEERDPIPCAEPTCP